MSFRSHCAGLVLLTLACGTPPAVSPDSESTSVKDNAEPSEAAPASEHTAPSTLPYLASEATEGVRQSPINLVTSKAVEGVHETKLHYGKSREHISNLGHTVKVDYDDGSTLDFDGHSYKLLQFHFHTPSEHMLDGITYPMEIHLVHARVDDPARYLVIGALFKEGSANPLLATLLDAVPTHAGEHVDGDVQLDARALFQPGEGYFHYEGSLTTPPYTEAVTWLVLDGAHQASGEQIEAFNHIEGNNARHIQSLRARVIDHSRLESR